MTPPRALRWLWGYQAAVYGLGLVIVAGLIPAWGQWYSQSLHYRRQVDALLRGELALSHDPAALAHDLAWSQEGVHQVWGLGVPLWRLPFEAGARLVGLQAFPDMLALAVALGLAAWVVLRFLGQTLVERRTSGAPDGSGGTSSEFAWPHGWLLVGAAVLLLLFPPFVNLLHTRLDIYEEAVAYEYLVGLGLIAGLLGLAHRPTAGRFWGVCAWAGLGGLVRPTLVLHGGAAVAAAVLALWLGRNELAAAGNGRGSRGRWGKTVGLGLALFGLGGGVLFGTNWARFGSGFEFGHQLNVQHLYGSLYATRLDDPYQDEPLPSAAGELFGLLFRTQEIGGGNFYKEQFFPGQSPTVRWREVYLSAYDPSYLAALLGGWAAAAVAVWRQCGWRNGSRRQRTTPRVEFRAIAVVGVYSAIASVLLLGFYLRTPVISSRYLLDLMPAFAAGLMAAWLAWGALWQRRRGGAWALGLSVLVLGSWSGWQVLHSRRAYGPPRPVPWAEVVARKAVGPPPVTLPARGGYESAAAAHATGIPFNGAGWSTLDAGVQPCVILFVQDPEFLELDVITEDAAADATGPVAWRAKVGLEFLDRQSQTRGPDGWTLRFTGPRRRQYQRGLQPVFLATVPKEHLTASSTPWRLRRVRWRVETTEH